MRPCNRHLPARAVIIAMLCLAFTFTGSAGALTPTIVIDADTGRVLQHQDSRRRWYPASLAKVMTLYLVFERLEAGGLADDQLLEVSSHAAAQPAVRLGLRNRERISVRDAILAIVTLSANDAAVVLAEAVAGSEPAFILRMDAKARQLGLQSTRFANATGLPGPDQFTTARDMAVLGRALLQSFPGPLPVVFDPCLLVSRPDLHQSQRPTASVRGRRWIEDRVHLRRRLQLACIGGA